MNAAKGLIKTAIAMNASGLNHGSAGNLSVRVGNGLLLTPSGLDYAAMAERDVVRMTMDGKWSCDNRDMKPTSEWRFHLDIMAARGDVGAVVHVHSPFATALACLRRGIPAFNYMVAVAGGKRIDCADYATFGSAELSENVMRAMDGRLACLMANHGMIACGRDLPHALAVAVDVEQLAAQYMRVLQVGEPIILDDEEMDRVLEKFKAGYGYGSTD